MQNRQQDFLNICTKCKIDCCKSARPPISQKRKEIILEYLNNNNIFIKKTFLQTYLHFPM